jgi:transposase-like protein
MMTACRNWLAWSLGLAEPDPRDRPSVDEARQDLAAWIAKWQVRYPKLVGWIEETVTFYRLPVSIIST